jgi:hypothetical protein
MAYRTRRDGRIFYYNDRVGRAKSLAEIEDLLTDLDEEKELTEEDKAFIHDKMAEREEQLAESAEREGVTGYAI